jgi:hypothetical protein
MKPVRTHIPGPPKEEEPPKHLVDLADAVADPLVIQHGITTTRDGRWALYVTVPADTTVPIASVEQQAKGFPVVYEAEPDEPVRAGPAYPDLKRRGR